MYKQPIKRHRQIKGTNINPDKEIFNFNKFTFLYEKIIINEGRVKNWTFSL